MYVTKHNGAVVLFDTEKVAGSIIRANAEVEDEPLTKSQAEQMASSVYYEVIEKSAYVTTADVRACVYRTLCQKGLTKTARKYQTFSKNTGAKIRRCPRCNTPYFGIICPNCGQAG